MSKFKLELADQGLVRLALFGTRLVLRLELGVLNHPSVLAERLLKGGMWRCGAEADEHAESGRGP